MTRKTRAQMLADVPSRFEQSYMPEPNSGCWLWLRAIDRGGYGRFTIGRNGTNKIVGAHIISFWLKNKKLPPSELDHLCKVRCCVNPDHLEPVTHYENLMRGDGWGGVNARKTHCINGHEFTPENTYIWKGPKVTMRTCRICNAKRVAALKAKKNK